MNRHVLIFSSLVTYDPPRQRMSNLWWTGIISLVSKLILAMIAGLYYMEHVIQLFETFTCLYNDFGLVGEEFFFIFCSG